MNFKYKNLVVQGIKKNKNAPKKGKQKRTIFTRMRTRSHSINRTGGPVQQGNSHLAWARPSLASQHHMNKHQLNQEKRQRNRAENLETELCIWQELLYDRVGITIVGRSLSNNSLGDSDPATEKQIWAGHGEGGAQSCHSSSRVGSHKFKGILYEYRVQV